VVVVFNRASAGHLPALRGETDMALTERARRWTARVVAAGLLGATTVTGTTTAASAAPAADPPSVPNELVVTYEAGATEAEKAAARSRAGTPLAERVVAGTGAQRAVELVRTTGLDRAAAARNLTADPAVAVAEPNWIYTHAATSTDPYYTNGSLWGMYGDASTPANQYGSQAGEAWSSGNTGSASVYVGVIDEGIQFDHPDLAGQVWSNPYDAADGVDNDGNGYVDDVRGWDFANGDSTIYDGGTKGNLDDHGTHVSGTIGAANNGTGVVGVNWNVKLISGKFLGRNGGTTANAVKAVDYFTDLKTRHGLNIVATNNSWGGGGSSTALLDAIRRADVKNILFIAAAGNGGRDGVGDDNDRYKSYPSGYDVANVIAVAAIDSKGAKAGFSNYGATTVDIGAPGVGVWSTTAYNKYESYSGTSMATPHVSGGAALYAASHPGASAAQIKGAILGSTVPTASLAGKTATGGRLNVSGF
jgi:subtilisin family serine protease